MRRHLVAAAWVSSVAGGGFCSLKAPGAPVAGSVMGLGLGAVAVAMSRRSRRRDP